METLQHPSLQCCAVGCMSDHPASDVETYLYRQGGYGFGMGERGHREVHQILDTMIRLLAIHRTQVWLTYNEFW
jgi:hypothetical protein